MNYSVELLTTVVECNLILAEAEKEKSLLSYHQQGMVFKKDAYQTTGVEIDAELATLSAEMTILQNIIAGLPEGVLKNEHIVKFKKAEYTQFLLTQRDKKYGMLVLLDHQLELEKNIQTVAVLTNYIAVITARKAAII